MVGNNFPRYLNKFICLVEFTINRFSNKDQSQFNKFDNLSSHHSSQVSMAACNRNGPRFKCWQGRELLFYFNVMESGGLYSHIYITTHSP